MKRNDADTKRLADAILRWRVDPGMFVRQVFGAKPWAGQDAILNAIAPPGAHVAVRSGHRCGKSTALAWLVLWFTFCFKDSRVPCTAPGAGQLRDVLWPEIRKWHNRMHPFFKAHVRVTADHVRIVGMEQSQFAAARTARKEQPEALQGFHGDNLLFCLDECSGIPQQIFEVAEGALAGPGARVIMTSNPTRNDGYFYTAFHKDRASWTLQHMSSEDSPLVQKSYYEGMARRYGKNSDIYRIRVLGDFPKGGGRVVLPLDLLEAAQAFPSDKAHRTGNIIRGVDIARFGDDDSATADRDGGVTLAFNRWHGNATTESAGKIMHDFGQGMFHEAKVDVIGVGAGVADILRENGKFPVADINVGEAARDEQFNRYRDELYWKGREWLETGEASLPTVEECPLVEDFIAEACGIEYGFTPSGKIRVEEKDQVKDRIGHSPDLTDAWLNTFAEQQIEGVASWFNLQKK